MPTRIQRKRTRGWRVPENTVYVGRPTQWGNDVRVGEINWDTNKEITAEEAVQAYEEQLRRRAAIIGKEKFTKRFIEPLRGKNLLCWCPLSQPCHADVLLRIANQ